MIGRKELRQAFEHKPFVTKGYVMKQMGYKKYDNVSRFFEGLESIGRRYLTEDVIGKIMEYREYAD